MWLVDMRFKVGRLPDRAYRSAGSYSFWHLAAMSAVRETEYLAVESDSMVGHDVVFRATGAVLVPGDHSGVNRSET